MGLRRSPLLLPYLLLSVPRATGPGAAAGRRWARGLSMVEGGRWVFVGLGWGGVDGEGIRGWSEVGR